MTEKNTASYRVGEEVSHARFGVGVVTQVSGHTVVVSFGGDKRLFVPEVAPLTKTGKTNPEFAASRNNGNTDGIEAYRGGALHASPSEEVRERIRTFISLGDKQGWSPYDDTDIDDDDGELVEMMALAAEAGQKEALAKLFAASRKNGRSTSKRPKGYADWNPHKKTRIIVSQVEAVLREYRAQLPLTARQIFYRLVGAYGYAKDERAYERLTNILVRARRAKMIPFECIRDDGASVLESEHYENKEQFYRRIREMGEDFTRDKLARQGLDVRIYCEAAGMLGSSR